MAAVRATFKPEFLNRLDDIIVFDSLTTEELTEIVDLQVRRLASGCRTPADARGHRRRKEWLAVTGFDPVYGARPLRRLIQSAIGDKLAKSLIAGEITDGDRVLVDLDEAADSLRVGPSAYRGDRQPGLSLVEQPVVLVLGQPEVVADPVPEPEQHPQLGLLG